MTRSATKAFDNLVDLLTTAVKTNKVSSDSVRIVDKGFYWALRFICEDKTEILVENQGSRWEASIIRRVKINNYHVVKDASYQRGSPGKILEFIWDTLPETVREILIFNLDKFNGV